MLSREQEEEGDEEEHTHFPMIIFAQARCLIQDEWNTNVVAEKEEKRQQQSQYKVPQREARKNFKQISE